MRLKKVSDTLNYDRTKKPVDKRVRFERKESKIEENWKFTDSVKSSSKYLWYLLMVTFLFFIGTLMVAFYAQYVGIDRVVTTEKISIIIQGPLKIDSGSSASFSLRVANRNPVAIEDAVLSIIYPEGSYKETGSSDISILRRENFSLGILEKNEIINKNISFILFGEKDALKDIDFELEYRARGSSRKVVAKEKHKITLRSSNVILAKPIFTDPVVGKEIVFSIPISSNSQETIPMLFVQVKYPDGFNVTGTSPKAENQKNGIWMISNLRPGQKRVIEVQGFIMDIENSEKSILAEVFIIPSAREKNSVLVAKESSIIRLENAFIHSNIKLNGISKKEIIISPGGLVSGRLNIENIDSGTLQGVSVILQLGGDGLDRSSIKGPGAYYDEIQNRLIWDVKEYESLKLINKGDNRSFSFSFKALPDRIDFAKENKNITLSLSVEAERSKTGFYDIAQNISSSKVLLRSVIDVNSQTQFLTSVLKNNGKLPPEVGEPIQYTLKYFIRNSGSVISNVSLDIPLERGVELTGNVDGIRPNEYIYNEDEHSVKISIPNISPVGQNAVRTIELQVVITPSNKDDGKILELTKGGKFSATDTYTKENIEREIFPLTSELRGEPVPRTDWTVIEGN